MSHSGSHMLRKLGLSAAVGIYNKNLKDMCDLSRSLMGQHEVCR